MGKFLCGVLALAFACVSGIYAGETGLKLKSKALAHYIMAVDYDLNGRTVEAVAEYERAVALAPQESLPRLRLAAYYVRLDLLDKAIAQLQEILVLDPHHTQAHYVLALVYSSLKKYDQAAAQYEAVLKDAAKQDPQNLEIYAYLAQLYFSQKQYSKAVEQFGLILAIQPDNVSANFLIASAYNETGLRGKAREHFQKVLVQEPEHDGALNALAYMSAEDGTNLDEALTQARKAVSIDGTSGAYYDTLGWVLFKKGLGAEALMALQKAEVYVQDPVVFEHIGDVYQAVKELALARKYWLRSLDLDPQQPALKTKIADLEKTQAFKKQQ